MMVEGDFRVESDVPQYSFAQAGHADAKQLKAFGGSATGIFKSNGYLIWADSRENADAIAADIAARGIPPLH